MSPSRPNCQIHSGLVGALLGCASLVGFSLVGCAPGNEETAGVGGTGGHTSTGSQGGGFMSGPGGGGAGGESEGIAEVYGHSASRLYRLDPNTKVVTTVADFSDCGSVIDIALDKDSRLIATSFSGLYAVDKSSAACSQIAPGTFPNSLSFIPAGTLDPNVEALVGYQGDQYVRIDPVSGAQTFIGSPWNNGLSSSGDIVSVKGGKSYLTVKGAGCATDCLVEIQPSSGAMLKNWGPLGYSNVYGIAFWAGSVFGFSEGGALFEVTFEGQQAQTHLIINPPNTIFWGAGSTTSAPPEPVPQ